MFITIQTAITDTLVWTKNSTLVTLAILLLAPRLLATASLRMNISVLRYFRLESLRVSLEDRFHGTFSLFISLSVATILAVAIRSTTQAQSKTVAVELQALRLLAVAGYTDHWLITFITTLHEIVKFGIGMRTTAIKKQMMSLMVGNWMLKDCMVGLLSRGTNHVFIIIWSWKAHNTLHHSWTAITLDRQLVMENIWTFGGLELWIVSGMILGLRRMIDVKTWYLLLIIDFLEFPLHIRLLIALRSRVLKTAVRRRSSINLFIWTIQKLRVKSLFKSTRIFLAAAHRSSLNLISFICRNWDCQVIAFIHIEARTLHVHRDLIVDRSCVIHMIIMMVQLLLWSSNKWGLRGMSLLLLFSRWRYIDIHLDICVDEIWIFEIKLRHHSILRRLSCRLLVQTSALVHSVMMWIWR